MLNRAPRLIIPIGALLLGALLQHQAVGAWPFETGGLIISSPAIADLDDDGQLEILFASWDGKVYCTNIFGDELWSVPLVGPDGYTTSVYSSPALANLDDDERTLEVIIGCAWGIYCLASDGQVLAFFETQYQVQGSPLVIDLENDGVTEIIAGEGGGPDVAHLFCISAIWEQSELALVERWSVPFSTYFGYSSVESAPAVIDVSGDGVQEIVAAGTGVDPVRLLNSDGGTFWNLHVAGSAGYHSPSIADLDHDGGEELLVASGSQLYCLRAPNGIRRWQTQVHFGSIGGRPAVADLLYHDGMLETVYGNDLGSNEQPDDLFCVDHAGQLLWTAQVPGTIAVSSPAIGDLDGDGILEIVACTSDTAELGRIYAFDNRGNIRWVRVMPGAVSSSPALADLDGDGHLEIAVGCYDHNFYALNWQGDIFEPSVAPKPLDLAPWPMFRHDDRRSGFYRRPGHPPDITGDGQVDGADLSLLLGQWGTCPPRPAECLTDLNGDGTTNAVDLSVLLGRWTPTVAPVCPGLAGCCAAHDLPGCDDQVCCTLVCDSDPFCCTVLWDAVCASRASDLCESCPSLCPGLGSCCEYNEIPGPGCMDQSCCEEVCSGDPYCCTVVWDYYCGIMAEVYCYPLCTSKPAVTGCGDPAAGCCCSAKESPFCDNLDCCTTICALDSFCCEAIWDRICVDEAIDLCGSCPLRECGNPGYALTDLGTLGGSFSRAKAINDAGQVTGFSQLSNNFTERAFRWEPGSMINLGALGGTHSSGQGINYEGHVVGCSAATNQQIHAFIWEGGPIMDLGTPSTVFSEAAGINNAGQVTGRKSFQAYIWQDGVWMDILPPPLSSFSAGLAINQSGHVAGRMNPCTGCAHRAFLWVNGVVTPHEPLPGYLASWGQAMNDSDWVGGHSYNRLSEPRATLWPPGGGPIDLGISEESEVLGMNNPGHAVGYYGEISEMPTHRAVLWKKGVATDLNDAIPYNSGWTLREATDINNFGQIVGSGVTPGGLTHAFLLNPCDGDETTDLNCDGSTNAYDLSQLLGDWGPCAPYCRADLNGDGAVNPIDLALLLGNWG